MCAVRRPTSSIASNPAFALSFSQNSISENGELKNQPDQDRPLLLTCSKKLIPNLGTNSQRSFHSSRQSNLFKSSGFGAGGGSEETKAADGSADQTAEETPITKEEYEVSDPYTQEKLS